MRTKSEGKKDINKPVPRLQKNIGNYYMALKLIGCRKIKNNCES